jgi:DNA repair exonuclease SbcCD ATPase subunit
VVLITHVETVREGLDHVIRLEYDERTGASVIREDVTNEVQVALF